MPYSTNHLIQVFKNKFSDKFNIDISLIVLLCVVTQHSFLIKCFGIFIIILLNFRSLWTINIFKIPFFYTIIPSLEILKFFFLDPDFSNGHIAQFLIGTFYWLVSLIICWIIYVRVQENEQNITERSLQLFVLLNLIFSITQIAHICFIEGVINPYNTGHAHPYGMSSGDMINGIFHGVHITNAFVSVLLTIYYTYRRNIRFMLFALFPLLLCCSNYATIVLVIGLGILILVSSDRKHVLKFSLLIATIIVGFYCFITPQNATYTATKITSILGRKPINNEQYIASLDKKNNILKVAQTTLSKKNEDSNIQKPIKVYDFVTKSGKSTSYKQTVNFLASQPKYLFLGAGMGRFSSSLAFDFSGVTNHLLFKNHLPHYESKIFTENHKSIYLFMLNSNIIFHSESNKPLSTYNQLLGEYGLIGIASFFILYLFYFFKRTDKKSYSIPIIIVVLFAFNINYYIESINLLVFYELLSFINIKEKWFKQKQADAN
jgi:hypothetical protein